MQAPGWLFIITFLSSFFYNQLKAQNLFPNPGFEEYEFCPTGYYSVEDGSCTDWSCMSGTPDYWSCSNYQLGYLEGFPSSGEGYMGMLGATNNIFCNGDLQREWIGATLNNPLIPCERYKLQFDLRLAYVGNLAEEWAGLECLDFGFYFYRGFDPAFCDAMPCGCEGFVPQITVPSTNLGFNQYVTFTTEFKATGPLNKVIIGPYCNGLTATQACNGPDADYDPYIIYYNLDNIILEHIEIELSLPDMVLCENEMLVLDASIPGALFYVWQDGSTNPKLEVSEPGIYTIAVATECSTLFDTILVTEHPTPAVDLGPDTVFCDGEIIPLNATFPGAYYQWQNGAAGPVYNAATTGIYWVEVFNMCGATSDTIVLTEIQTPVFKLGDDITLCEGDTILLDASTALAQYIWHDLSQEPIYSIEEEGQYWVDIIHPCGLVSDTINVYEYSPPVIDLGKDTVICEDALVLLDASFPFAEYNWQDHSTQSMFEVDASGFYWVEVRNPCGLAVDTIEISEIICSCDVYIPNVFSPNLDNINDDFTPFFECDPEEYELVIFDRWGTMVFNAENIDQSWGGKHRDRPLPSGVYAYFLRFKYDTGETEIVNGNITLIR